MLAVCLLQIIGAAIAPAQSVSAFAAGLDLKLRVLFELDDVVVDDPTPEQLNLLPDRRLGLVAELSWQGGEELVHDITLEPLRLSNAALGAGAPALTLPGAMLQAVDGRTVLRWSMPIVRQAAGAASLSSVQANVMFRGFEGRPAFRVEAPGVEWRWVDPPFPYLTILLWAVLGIGAVAGLGFGTTLLMRRAREMSAQREAHPVFGDSNDPTPFEQAHAELASCDMKAQTGDFDGYFAKLRPIIYNFAAATEGPRVRGISSDELARHLASVDYNAKVAALLVDCLKVCEHYEATQQEPTEEMCVALVRDLRAAAIACIRRSPRGHKNAL